MFVASSLKFSLAAVVRRVIGMLVSPRKDFYDLSPNLIISDTV
jgi:hypothetical protein